MRQGVELLLFWGSFWPYQSHLLLLCLLLPLFFRFQLWAAALLLLLVQYHNRFWRCRSLVLFYKRNRLCLSICFHTILYVTFSVTWICVGYRLFSGILSIKLSTDCGKNVARGVAVRINLGDQGLQRVEFGFAAQALDGPDS